MVIRSTRVVLPSGIQPAEIHIEGHRIDAVRPYLAQHPSDPAPRASASASGPVHDVGQLVVMPGLVDTHVHVNEPGRTEWEGFDTATRAAAAGGVTTIVDMPLNCVPPTTTRGRAGRQARRRPPALGSTSASGAASCPATPPSSGPLVAAGRARLQVLPARRRASPSSRRSARPSCARRCRFCADCGLPLLVHAELAGRRSQRDSRRGRSARATGPSSTRGRAGAEDEAIALLIALCRDSAPAIHVVHLSASDGRWRCSQPRRAEGLPISAETCPHYLTSPPRRSPTARPSSSARRRSAGARTASACGRRCEAGTDRSRGERSLAVPAGAEAAERRFRRGVGRHRVARSSTLPAVWTGARGAGDGRSPAPGGCRRRRRGSRARRAQGRDRGGAGRRPGHLGSRRGVRGRAAATAAAPPAHALRRRDAARRVHATYARGRQVYRRGALTPRAGGPARE